MSDQKEPTAFEIVWRNPWVRAVAYTVAIVLAVAILWALRGSYAFALHIAIIGFFIAYILNPVVEVLGRIRIGRAVAVVIVYLLLLQFALLGSVLVSQVVIEADRLVRLIPAAIQNIVPFLERSSEWWLGWRETLPDFLVERFGMPEEDDGTIVQIEQTITQFLEEQAVTISAGLRDFVANAGNYLLVGAARVISTTLQIFLIFIVSAYFLYDFPRITSNFRRYVPARWRPLYGDVVSKTDRIVSGFLRGRLLASAILGIFLWVGLSIIGVPLALTISVLAAVLNLVPYLGPVVGAIPAVLLGFTVSPLVALLAALVFVAANLIEANVLGPLLLSKTTNVHPVTVLIAILVGAGLLGLLGVLLAVPTVALLKVFFEDYVLKRPAYQGVVLSEDVDEPVAGDRERAVGRGRLPSGD